jgi:spore germination protein GerM
MVEPSNHCPYLGLKQNRAIRFAAPTPEHRCFVTGEAQEIPVDQESYCLCKEHVSCPLYMGLSMSSTPAAANLASLSSEQSGLRAWLAGLSPRDRVIYGVLMTVMLGVLSIYMVLAVQLLLSINVVNGDNGGALPPAAATATAAAGSQETTTSTPVVTPTLRASATATSAAAPTPGSTAAPTPSSTPLALTDEPIPQDEQWLHIYFAGPDDRLLIPVSRSSPVDFNQATPQEAAEAALQALLDGPADGSNLRRTLAQIPADARLLEVTHQGDTITVNFASSPGDDRALRAVVLTLTELPGMGTMRVQAQVNGQDIGLQGGTTPMRRFAINVDNPRGLPEAFGSGEASFLPLYFVSGDYYARITRLVPRTQGVARATVTELLKGPGAYSDVLSQPIGFGTELNNIWFAEDDDQRIVVDLTQAFADNTDPASRQAALDMLVLSLTDLGNIERVEVLVEGQKLSEYWGSSYDKPYFSRPVINPE